MGPIGVQEMIGIFLIALLLFGPKKLPELGRMLGKGMREFKRMKNEVKTTFETHLQELDRETRLSEISQPKVLEPAHDYSSANYSYPYEDSVHQAPTYETTAAVEAATGSPVVSHTMAHDLAHLDVVPGTVARNGSVPSAIPAAQNGSGPVQEEHPA